MTVPATPKQHDLIAGLAASKAIPAEAAEALFNAALDEAFSKKEAHDLIDSLFGEEDREIPAGIHVPTAGPWKGEQVEVKISKRSNRPYAVRVEDGEYLNGKGLFSLSADTLVEEAAKVTEVPQGIHFSEDNGYVKVVRSRGGNLYSLYLNEGGKFKDYRGQAGLVGLSEDTLLDAEKAAAFGHQFGMCVFCGRTLTDEDSVEVGYGPVCAENNGLPHGS